MKRSHEHSFAKHILLMLLFASVIGLIVQLLWNWLVPELFNGPAINYGQALGLFFLSKLLLAHPHHSRPRPGERGSYWKSCYKESKLNAQDAADESETPDTAINPKEAV